MGIQFVIILTNRYNPKHNQNRIAPTKTLSISPSRRNGYIYECDCRQIEIDMNKTTDDDHYKVLGLPSGEKGSKLTEKQIKRAYLAKALELHPDKSRKSDPQANTDFQRLHKSYAILTNESSRKEFDKTLRDQRQKELRQSERDPKRQKMVFDLEARERAAKFDRDARVRQEKEERMKRKLDEECARYRRRRSLLQPVVQKMAAAPTPEKYDEPDRVNNLVGVGFRTFEDEVLKKLAKAGQKQKLDRQGV